jgi:hypothetical protein
VISTLISTYAVIALVSAVAVFVLSDRVSDDRRPATHRALLSLSAGIIWPVLLIGIAEFGSFAMYAKVHEHADDRAPVLT